MSLWLENNTDLGDCLAVHHIHVVNVERPVLDPVMVIKARSIIPVFDHDHTKDPRFSPCQAL